MSTREIIAELPRLTLAELHAVEQRIAELTARRTADAAHTSTPIASLAGYAEPMGTMTNEEIDRAVYGG